MQTDWKPRHELVLTSVILIVIFLLGKGAIDELLSWRTSTHWSFLSYVLTGMTLAWLAGCGMAIWRIVTLSRAITRRTR